MPCCSCCSLLDESKVLGLDGEQELAPEDGLAGVERHVQPGDARVGGRQVRVAGGADRHARHRLEAVLGRRKGGGTWGQEKQLNTNSHQRTFIQLQLST